MKTVLLAIAALTAMAAGARAWDMRIEALDLALDPKPAMGKRVLVRGCTITVVDVDHIYCDVERGGQRLAVLGIEVATLSKEDRRWLVTACTSQLYYRCQRLPIEATIVESQAGSPLLSAAEVMRSPQRPIPPAAEDLR